MSLLNGGDMLKFFLPKQFAIDVRIKNRTLMHALAYLHRTITSCMMRTRSGGQSQNGYSDRSDRNIQFDVDVQHTVNRLQHVST